MTPARPAASGRDSLFKGDGESWEIYAHRLETRVKHQRHHLESLHTLHKSDANRSDRDVRHAATLWDSAFRARLLRQGLSNDEMAQAVEVAEVAAAERAALREALEVVADLLSQEWRTIKEALDASS